MTSALYLLAGLAILLAALLPSVLSRWALSPPVVLLGAGMAIGLLPIGDRLLDPVDNREVVEQVTQFAVLLALMGVGLALDRPLRLRHPRDWLRWSATWRLLLVAMPLTIAAVWLIGWWGLGLGAATALVLGAALAPTDPVLAGDVQVGGPDVESQEEDESDERHEVRFALTSEAGLNDGLAFPFVYAAIYLATKGSPETWLLQWVAWEVVGRVVVGFLAGALVGWVLAKLAFRARRLSLGWPSRASRCWRWRRSRRRTARPSCSGATGSSPSSAAAWRSGTPSGTTTTRPRCTVSSSASNGCSRC